MHRERERERERMCVCPYHVCACVHVEFQVVIVLYWSHLKVRLTTTRDSERGGQEKKREKKGKQSEIG